MSKPLAVLLVAGLLVSPAGLLLAVGAIGPGTISCSPGAFPTRTSTDDPPDDAGGEATGGVPETSRVVMPLPEGTYAVSDSYGWRTDPFTGRPAFHSGTDFPARAGTQVLAVADGVVLLVGYLVGGWGNYVVVTHTVQGEVVASLYGHLLDGGTHVTAGQTVQAGDWIADVGSTGRSTGPHLHLQVHPGGWGHETVDPLTWLAGHGAQGVPEAPGPAGCVPTSTP